MSRRYSTGTVQGCGGVGLMESDDNIVVAAAVASERMGGSKRGGP